MQHFILLILSLLLANSAYAESEQEKPPIVLELFTSQNCPACPPAEKLFNELVGKDGLLTLAFHVDYMDSGARKDPYGSSANSNRQRLYAYSLKKNSIYTPQLVINGKYETIGHDWRAINKLVEDAEYTQDSPIPLSITRTDDKSIELTIAENTPIEDEYLQEKYDIWLFTIIDMVENKITHGANKGKTMRNLNIVKDIYKLGSWSGGKTSAHIDIAKFGNVDAIAVIIQKPRLGQISNAIYFPLNQK